MTSIAAPTPISKPLQYAYYPGCVAQGACRELHDSTLALADRLGIELIQLKKAACCGSGTFKEDSQLLEDTVNARNIALAESLGLPLLTHCSTCQGVIGHVDERLKQAKTEDPNYFAQVNGLLQQEGCAPYQGSGAVKHILWALVADYGLEALTDRVTRKLSGLKCAAFYGCYILRGQTHGFDDPINPQSMENVFQTLGAEAVVYPGRTQCCGWPISSYATDQSFAMAGGIYERRSLL
ncbi:MAG: heterodisulfide reductase, partial [Alkalinema sp. RL_2_19]|nr:heterodisulfide reductase [Alkalinema sp. RL_2_19]